MLTLSVKDANDCAECLTSTVSMLYNSPIAREDAMTTARRYFDTFSGVYLPEQPSSPPAAREQALRRADRQAGYEER